ncbi:SIS domain-containing protein [Tropicimonas sp. IMCC6043]|uniref:SIS domain-containing protein n=1 Tax=Tropicimonas sp. IMCC6043 TaxID=2510645 RepID=UPI00101CB70A|nr:SIS domain-containing protein [Tropicimonas sp. IMCC6043]RYH07144.1 SIS domain-containing protein [Tropicimonas sp. IMCC6043]
MESRTEAEISAQPDIWEAWATELPPIAGQIRDWIAARAPDEIWLCGAGTSAFIADSLVVGLNRCRGIPLVNVASTDLVARPGDFFRTATRPLVMSFGRSGNSSESIGTLDLLDRVAPDADRLNITCNSDSVLATRRPEGTGEWRVVTLPAACHDAGFAMTSSYTTMLITALACLSDTPIDALADRMRRLAQGARALMAQPVNAARPGRAVFLGSGPFKGTARESALKVLELTAGQVVTSWDSTLGFRHGPKAVLDDDSSVFVFLSSDDLTRKYDQDIVTEIRDQFPKISVTTIGAPMAGTEAPDIPLDTGLEDVWNTPLAVLPAQRLSVAWSKSLALNVDDPFAGRTLTRVVSNVRLYS